MDITIKQLEIFRGVVVAGSITKASRRLGLSQPSISQQLAKLEKTLGAQLILRNRTGIINLTPAGEYWYGIAVDMLRRLDGVAAEHRARFAENSVSLRMGMTPTLRGRFIAAAATIAAEEPGFVKFEMRYALTSTELVEQFKLHQINCALINAEAIADDRASFAVSDVLTDPLALVVPASVPIDDLRFALANPQQDMPGPLSRFIDVDASIPLHNKTEHWYRHNLPTARAMFTTTTYPTAIDICEAGLATTHCPLSLVPNLPPATLERLRFFRIDDVARTMALVMPKHLVTLPSYARIFRRIEEFCRTEYSEEMLTAQLQDLPVSAAPAIAYIQDRKN